MAPLKVQVRKFMQLISSSNNPTIKKAMRLHENRGRRQQARIIVFGESEIIRAAECGICFSEIFVCPELLSNVSSAFLGNLHPARDTSFFQLTSDLFQKLAFGRRSDGMVAVAERPNTDLACFQSKKNSLVIVLESLGNPGNVGAVFRSADAAGVDAVLLADPACDLFHPNAIRSSLGTVFSISAACAKAVDIKQYLLADKFRIVTTRVDSVVPFTKIDLTKRVAIVLGTESTGLSKVWSGPEIEPVVIPMLGRADSLNIAMTSTLMAFEARRQRGLQT